MIAKAFQAYSQAYRGIGKPVWILAVVQLINRSGSMVLPFMTIYMTTSLGFTMVQVGIIMSIFGAGGLVGSFLGGKLTDSIGPFTVQVLSLITGGISYLILPLLTGFYGLAIGIFVSAVLNDSLRPANSAMTGHFATPETTTRSFSLMRMAINLGVAIGPAVAGLLAGISYVWLFVGDGITCIAAGIVFYFYFSDKRPQTHKEPHTRDDAARSPYKDMRYIWFLLLVLGYAAAFFQIFGGLPLYYKDVYLRTEHAIGLLLGFNGLIVFFFEMITVSEIEKRLTPVQSLVTGSVMLGISFILFNLFTGTWVLILSMILLSFSEIFVMPFMISHAIKTATPKTRGSYIAAYTIAWALAFILSPLASAQILDNTGFDVLWWVFGGLCLLLSVGFSQLQLQAASPVPSEEEKETM